MTTRHRTTAIATGAAPRPGRDTTKRSDMTNPPDALSGQPSVAAWMGRLGFAIVAASGLLMAAGDAHAYPAAYFTTATMTVPPDECSRTAADALRRAGETDVRREPWGATGTTPTSRGFIVCVALPRAGACGRDGATAVIVTAGDDADRLRDLVASNFHPSVPIDCG